MRHTSRRRSCRPASEPLESRALLTTYVVVNTQTHGQGSLGWAIRMANQHAGPDAINFNIPGDGEHDIVGTFGPDGREVQIRGKVIIDGYTQPGSARNTSTDPKVNNARIMVNIVNTSKFGFPALNIVGEDASGTQIRGLGLSNMRPSEARGESSNGIELFATKNVVIDGCRFWARGFTKMPRAIEIVAGKHNTIGGDGALQNVMANYNVGVELRGISQHNAIVGNLIGGEPTQSEDQQVGVWLRDNARHNNVVRNVLFKNTLAVKLTSTNVVEDNTIIDR